MKKILLILTSLFIATEAAHSQTGLLLYPDLGFQNCGKIRDAFLPTSNDQVKAGFRLANGRILLVGTATNTSNGHHIALARHMPNGDRDSTFGTNGLASPQFNFRSIAEGANLQADGKILVAGIEAPSNSGSQQIPCVMRFLANGAPDTAWGNGGRQAFRFDSRSSGRMAKAYPLGGGKVLSLGLSSSNINGGTPGFGAVRFTADGSFDGAFGTNGISQIPRSLVNGAMVSVGGGFDSLYYSILQVTANNIGYDLQIARYTNNGLDMTFRGTGIDSLSRTELGWPNTTTNTIFAALQADGKVIVLTHSGNLVWHVTRILKTGLLDTTFGTNGNVAIPVFTLRGFNSTPQGITIQDDGKILLMGQGSQSLAIRLQSNGTLDASWGDQGFLTIDVNQNAGSQWISGYFPDGAGHLFYGTDFAGNAADFVLARVIPTLPVALISSTADSLCPGDTALLAVSPSSCTNIITWLRDGNPIANGATFTARIGGNYRAFVDYNFYQDTSDAVSIWASSLTTPVITQDRGQLSTTAVALRYQWFRNGVAIPNATGAIYLAAIAGSFQVQTFDIGCSMMSLPITVTILSAKPDLKDAITAIYSSRANSIQISGDGNANDRAVLISSIGTVIPLTQLQSGTWAIGTEVVSGIYRIRMIRNNQFQSVTIPVVR